MSTSFAARSSPSKSCTPSPSTPRQESGTDRDSLQSQRAHGYATKDTGVEPSSLNADQRQTMLDTGTDGEEEADGEIVIAKDGISENRLHLFEIYSDGSQALVDLTDPIRSAPHDTPNKSFNTLSTFVGGTKVALRSRQQNKLNKMRGGRVPRISETLQADKSYDASATDNANAVWKLLNRPLEVTPGKSAFVYAFRDKDLDLVKIGWALDIEKRKKKLVKSCKITGGLIDVACSERVLAYKRLEKLIQQDLAPHRWFFGCDCRTDSSKGYVKHQEYFDVSNDVAKRTIKLWSDFIKQQYWEIDPLWTPVSEPDVSTRLKSFMSADSHRPFLFETHEDHDRRIQRWRNDLETEDATTAEPQRCLSGESAKPSLADRVPKSEIFDEDTKIGPLIKNTSQPAFRFGASLSSSNSVGAASNADCGAPRPATETLFDTNMFFESQSSPLAAMKKGNSGVVRPPDVEAHAGTESSSLPESRPGFIKQESHEVLPESLGNSTKITTPQKEFEVEIEDSARIIKHGPIDRNMAALLMEMLTKEARPLPARTISADLFQLRWPLICLAVFVLHSPYVPGALLFVMWSVFLPFFVAELRGWEMVEHMTGHHSDKLT
ncbi:hypothetical protein KCU77_g4169, partial [Aureobasidium melanogenum]